MEWLNDLPEQLEPFKDKLLATRRQFIEIVPTLEEPAAPWDSRFGGMPYLPKGTEFPASPSGEHLFFLAQVNLEQAPGLEPFPAKGILQFYINDDDLFGMDPGDPYKADHFRVLYFPEVLQDPAQLVSDFSFLRSYGDLPVYPDRTSGMEFELAEEIVPVSDFEFAGHLGADFFKQFGDLEWPLREYYEVQATAEGHKMGGYAHFAQEDPRKPEDQLVLLFQMDTDAEMECMWGDMGTAKFFIREEDLRKQDFSRVMYTWDCY